MNKSEIIDTLREHAIKITLQRILICEFLFNSASHPTAKEIYTALSRLKFNISLATVYKTLHELKDKGLIREFESGDNLSHFEPYLKPHVNLICRSCGNIEDHFSPEVSKFVQAISPDIPSPNIQYGLDFYIICKNCQIPS